MVSPYQVHLKCPGCLVEVPVLMPVEPAIVGRLQAVARAAIPVVDSPSKKDRDALRIAVGNLQVGDV